MEDIGRLRGVDANESTNQNAAQDPDPANQAPPANQSQSANQIDPAAGPRSSQATSLAVTTSPSSDARKSRRVTIQVEPASSSENRKLEDLWSDRNGLSTVIVNSMVYILFILLSVLGVASLAGTLSLGITLSTMEAWRWVQLVAIGLAVHIFLLETVKVLCVAYYYAFCLEKLMM